MPSVPAARIRSPLKGPKAYLYDPSSGFFHTLRNGTIIGRKNTAVAIQIADDDLISREHCKITYDGSFSIEDFFTVNPTRVNRRTLEPCRRMALAEGDVVRIGDQKLIFTRSKDTVPGANYAIGAGPASSFITGSWFILLLSAITVVAGVLSAHWT